MLLSIISVAAIMPSSTGTKSRSTITTEAHVRLDRYPPVGTKSRHLRAVATARELLIGLRITQRGTSLELSRPRRRRHLIATIIAVVEAHRNNVMCWSRLVLIHQHIDWLVYSGMQPSSCRREACRRRLMSEWNVCGQILFVRRGSARPSVRVHQPREMPPPTP